MESGLVRVGIIGTGFGGYVQLPGFLNIPDVQVMGIVSTHPEKSRDFAEKFHLPKIFASPEEMIADPDIDLISVASPQVSHKEIVSAVIKAGKHILCEKPFTLHSSDAKKLLDYAVEAGIIHAVDFEFREMAAWKLFYERVKSGSIGEVKSADLQWIVGSWADPARPWGWQCDVHQGGGVIAALGVHLFDAAEWLLGPMRSLTAKVGITITERREKSGAVKPVTAVDHADIAMKSAQGIPVAVGLSNVDADGDGLRMTVRGDRGALVLENTSKEYGSGYRVLEGVGDAHPTEILKDETPHGTDARIPPFQSLAERLVWAVRSRDTAFNPSFREGMRAQMIAEAVIRSNGSETDIA